LLAGKGTTVEMKEGLETLKEYQSEYGRLSQRLAQLKNTGLGVGSKAVRETSDRIAELAEEMANGGINASNLNDMINELRESLNEISNESGVPSVTQELTAYEKALNGVVDVTDSATQQMLSDFEYFSDNKKQAIIEGINQQIKATKVDIQAVKTRMAAYDELSNKIREANALTGQSIKLEKEYMRSLGASILKDEEAQLDDLIEQLNREEETLLNLTDANKSATDSTKDLSEPLSELEKKLRDARHQAELYEQELKRTDSYDEQIRLTKLIIEQKELEADALES